MKKEYKKRKFIKQLLVSTAVLTTLASVGLPAAISVQAGEQVQTQYGEVNTTFLDSDRRVDAFNQLGSERKIHLINWGIYTILEEKGSIEDFYNYLNSNGILSGFSVFPNENEYDALSDDFHNFCAYSWGVEGISDIYSYTFGTVENPQWKSSYYALVYRLVKEYVLRVSAASVPAGQQAAAIQEPVVEVPAQTGEESAEEKEDRLSYEIRSIQREIKSKVLHFDDFMDRLTLEHIEFMFNCKCGNIHEIKSFYKFDPGVQLLWLSKNRKTEKGKMFLNRLPIQDVVSFKKKTGIGYSELISLLSDERLVNFLNDSFAREKGIYKEFGKQLFKFLSFERLQVILPRLENDENKNGKITKNYVNCLNLSKEKKALLYSFIENN